MKFSRINSKVVFCILATLIFSYGNTSAYAKKPSRCGSTGFSQNDQTRPILCEDGSPNIGVARYLKANANAVMKLSKNASSDQIREAICAKSNLPNSIQLEAYKYVYALNDWRGIQPAFDEMWGIVFHNDYCAVASASAPKKAKFTGAFVYWQVINPASGTLTFDITNIGGKSAIPSCKVTASDKSGVYKGFDFPNFKENIRPGQTKTYSIDLIITNQGSAYVTGGKISC